MKAVFGIIIASAISFVLIGCDGGSIDPTKIGGGGLPQPYSAGTGQYVPTK